MISRFNRTTLSVCAHLFVLGAVGGYSHGNSLLTTITQLPTQQSAFDDEEGNPLPNLLKLLDLLCILYPCPGNQANANMPNDVRTRITQVIDTYEAHGIYPNLTLAQRIAGRIAVELNQKWVLTNPGLIDADLEARFVQALDDMADDLN